MTRRLMLWLAVGGLVMQLAGGAFGGLGVWCLVDAGATRAQAAAELGSRLRELDRLLRFAGRGPAGAVEARGSLTLLAKLPLGEAAHGGLARVQAGLAEARADTELEAALAPVRQALEQLAAESWERAAGRARLGWWLVWLGFAGLGAVWGGGLFALVRALRAAGVAAATEALLRQRTEQLYAAQLGAWEKERFAVFGEVAAGLSHGLKTPLAGIRAAAQLAQAKLPPDHAVAVQLDDIIAEVDTLVEQIRRFLQAAGSGAPMLRVVPVARLMQELDREYASNAVHRGLTWRCDAPESLGAVFVDPALLAMALRNLVENALCVAPRGTTVALAARAATAPPPGSEVAEGRRWLELVVRDEGPGIPEVALAGGLTTKPQGSGLGLALAQRIVSRQGGQLLVTRLELGTEARVILPAADAEVEANG